MPLVSLCVCVRIRKKELQSDKVQVYDEEANQE